MTGFSVSDVSSVRAARPGDPRPGPLALPADDAFAVNEGATLTGNVFSDNGSGPDVDGAPVVASVEGDAPSVGVEIVLASGALLTLNADGTFSYDPNGAFDALPAPGSGASITTAIDSFTYTLVGGGSATVTITVTGQDSIGDELIGTPGNDTLDGGAGPDLMAGGASDDIYYVDDVDDLVFELAGEGTDWIYSSVDYELMEGSYVQYLVLSGAGDLYASGNSFRNTLIGNAGDNILDGGASNDIMRGGDGDDAYFVDNVGDVVVELDGQGFDGLYSEISYTLSDTTFIEGVILLCGADINATGNIYENYLAGNCGDNVLNGMGGADIMEGSGGDDIYYVDDEDDWAIEYEGEGVDWVYSTVSYALLDGSFIQGLTLLGTDNLTATGNSFRNILTGNSGANALYGLESADILDGAGGADLMIGGTGDDTYYVDDAGDVIEEYVGEGVDTVFASVSYVLAAGVFVQTLTLTGTADLNATGNDYRNALNGNAGVNTLTGGGETDILDGKGGADIMIGGTGDDTYYVDDAGDVIVELSGEGVDTVFASVSYVLAAGVFVQTLTLTGTADLDATGNNYRNTLNGNAGVNTLTGGGGIDMLDGKGGADVMIGGTGDDTYYVDDAGDVIVELSGEGVDTVFTTVSYVLAAGVFVQTLTLEFGTADLNLTGNAYRNALIGNDGDNILDGGGGADVLQGGDGDDTYYVDHVDDVVMELAGEGYDTVLSSTSYALLSGAYVNILTLTGTADLNATGNSYANALNGNSGANRLNGAGGADVLTGGAGADTFVFTSAAHSTVASSDRITDLTNADFIDLSAIDANVNVGGVQHFVLVDDFTNTAGQVTLTYDSGTGITSLNADRNGDGVSDMLVRIAGDHEDFANFIFGGG